jgi:hypothetical protein
MQKSNRKAAAINPLEELRRLLGTDEKPLHTSKLAALVDTPADTLRSIQIGRRSLTPDILKRMRRRGLDWDPQTKQWRFTYDRSAPLTLPLLESFQRLSRPGDDLFQDLDVDAAIRRVIALVQGVDDSAYRSLLLDLNDAFESLRVAYKVTGAQKEFTATELRFEYVTTRSGDQTLVKKYSGENPPDFSRLLNHSDKRKSHGMPDEESGELSGALKPAA